MTGRAIADELKRRGWTRRRAGAFAAGALVVILLLASIPLYANAPTSVETSRPRVGVAGASQRPKSVVGAPLPTATVTATPRSPGPSAVRAQPQDVQPSFPIRAAFYYPWFPEAWNQGGRSPYTNYRPSLGYYDSGNPAVIRRHISAMQYGRIEAGISSWWGRGTPTDGRLRTILSATAHSSFRWAVYHEAEGVGDPAVAALAADLRYLRDRYGSDPSYLRIDGRFVVFVYGDADEDCTTADRWKRANAVGAYIVLKVFPGYARCGSQPDGWHQYAPAVAADEQQAFSFTISPGFWKHGQHERLPRDLGRWLTDVRAMAASPARFHLVTTFNEWGEGTSVESALEWASPSGHGGYLDALHVVGEQR